MKNDKKEIIDYYVEMPAAFESLSQEAVNDSNISEVLVQKSLQLIPSNVGVGRAVCADADGNRLLVKYGSETEKIMYGQVLPAIRERNLAFKVLQFPELVSVTTKEQQNFLFIKHIDGTKFNDTWDEISILGYGGKGMKVDFANRVVDLVEDLSLIETSVLAKFDLSTFDFEKWKSQNLPFLSEILIKRGIITQSHIDEALKILSTTNLFASSRMILTNGDFYPRNLIELSDGKIAIVDWEGRQDYDIDGLVDQRNSFINYIENHIAFFFIHMWGNFLFQRTLIKEAAQRFGLTVENLQAAILIKSLEQSMIWPDDVANHEIEIFTNTLDINFVKDLLE